MAWWNRHRDGPPMIAETKMEQVASTSDPYYNAKAAAFDATFGPIITNYGTGFPSDSQRMYRSQPAVRTVVDFLGKNIGSLTLKTYARLANTDRLELSDHPLALLLRNPNPSTTGFRLMRDTVIDVAIEDVAYWRKFRDRRTGLVIQIARIPITAIEVSTVNERVTYRVVKTGEVIPRDDLVIFAGYHPDGQPYGVSPMETLKTTLREEYNATQHRAYFWKNAARREGVLERPVDAPPLSDPAAKRLREGWTNRTAGATNAGVTPLLEEGTHWVPDNFSPKESEYIEGRRLHFEEVCRAYNMAPKLFGVGDTTNANIESFHRQLYQDTLGPWLTGFEQEFELQLLPEVDRGARAAQIYCEFNLGAKLAASFEEQMSVLVTAAGVPIAAVNEGRARLNLPKIDNPLFDVPVMPMNVIYGGQPSTQIPTADPSTPPTEQVGTPNTRSVAVALVKAIPPSVERRRMQAADTQAKMFMLYFRAQERAYIANLAKAQKRGVKAAWDDERWDARLTAELYGSVLPLARLNGQRAAKQLGGVYNEDETLAWLLETSRRSATNINAETMKQLAATEDMDQITHVFDVAKGARATQLGLSVATGTINFARHDAARQSQNADGRERVKTWRVTSRHSRHPEMDGQTVGIDETFSNGMRWPGDPGGPTDDVAGCQCLVEFSTR